MLFKKIGALIAIVALAMVALPAPSSEGRFVPQTQEDFADLAKSLAPDIANKVVAKQGNASFRVAVFAPGNSEGKITIQMNEPQAVLQGELIVALTRAAAGKFLVLDKPGLAREFKAAGVDPSSVSASDPMGTGDALTKAGLDVAVVGSIDAKDQSQVRKDKLTDVKTILTIIFKDGSFSQISGSADPGSMTGPGTSLHAASGRLKAEIVLTSGGNNMPLPMFTARPGSGHADFENVLFAIVPSSATPGTANADFKIRLSNTGKGATPGPDGSRVSNPDSAKEANRIFAVALLIDGVNSIYQDQGNGTVGPVVVHPKNARRWLISGPDKLIVPDSAHVGGFRVDSARGKGHSVIDVPGFQKDTATSERFRFVVARESLAETLGITNEIGMIAAHFYAQKLPGDQLAELTFAPAAGTTIDLGTKAGPPVASPVFVAKPELYDSPSFVIRIFYRGEASCPIPPADRVPVTGP